MQTMTGKLRGDGRKIKKKREREEVFNSRGHIRYEIDEKGRVPFFQLFLKNFRPGEDHRVGVG